MSFVYISSTGDHAGQSLFAWVIIRRLMEKGYNPGIFKPFGTGPVQTNGFSADPDAFLFREFLKIPEPPDLICPFADPVNAEKYQDPKEVLDRIKKSAEYFHAGKDIVLILGSKHIFFDEALSSLPDVSVISELNADLILVHRYHKISATLYSILSVHSLLKKKVKGIIINRIPPDKMEDVKGQIIPVLSEKGILNICLVPEDPVLSFMRLGDILRILDGKVIFGEDRLDSPVERMSVGAANLSGDLLLFKRVYNKIILLGPSNECDIAGIIITGSRQPGEKTLEAVKKSNIPLITIKEDSLDALERLEGSIPSLSPADEGKVIRSSGIMDRNGSLDRLIDAITVNKLE